MPDEAPGVADKDHTPPAGPSPLATPSLVQPPGGLRVLHPEETLTRERFRGRGGSGGGTKISASGVLLQCLHGEVHALARRRCGARHSTTTTSPTANVRRGGGGWVGHRRSGPITRTVHAHCSPPHEGRVDDRRLGVGLVFFLSGTLGGRNYRNKNADWWK